MNKAIAITLALSVLVMSPQRVFAQNTEDKAQIEKIIESFRTSIVNKDEDGFLNYS